MDPLVHPEALAEYLQIKPKTLQNWRSRRVGPLFVRLEDGLIRYRQEDVACWLRQQADTSRDWMDD